MFRSRAGTSSTAPVSSTRSATPSASRRRSHSLGVGLVEDRAHNTQPRRRALDFSSWASASTARCWPLPSPPVRLPITQSRSGLAEGGRGRLALPRRYPVGDADDAGPAAAGEARRDASRYRHHHVAAAPLQPEHGPARARSRPLAGVSERRHPRQPGGEDRRQQHRAAGQHRVDPVTANRPRQAERIDAAAQQLQGPAPRGNVPGGKRRSRSDDLAAGGEALAQRTLRDGGDDRTAIGECSAWARAIAWAPPGAALWTAISSTAGPPCRSAACLARSWRDRVAGELAIAFRLADTLEDPLGEVGVAKADQRDQHELVAEGREGRARRPSAASTRARSTRAGSSACRGAAPEQRRRRCRRLRPTRRADYPPRSRRSD